MTFQEYQEKSRQTAIYPNLGNNYIYPVLGLCGESGEVAEIFKKIVRDKSSLISPQDKTAIAIELGDTLWYLSQITAELGMSLEEIAQNNIAKIRDRKTRNVLHGEGGNR
ncbi:MAG: nucleoside triphosphate pyrophosphohydrolase family protein [Patescibacteria group bacterium]|nr:nucleoside triphosphate pyrophosphohydrolase family protein [Patescibacteria group bacterium]